MAMLVALIMVTLILLIMASISYQQQLDFKRSSQILISDQVILLALSGESWAKKILADDDQSVDSFEDNWADSIPVMPVEGGWLTGCILDLNARFNINNLATYKTATLNDDLANSKASQATVYLALLDLLALDSTDDRVAVLVDWLDADDQLVIAGGAEDADYSIEVPARLAANRMLADISEIVAIKGYSARDLSLLRPHITALLGGTKINVNTASRQVLLAMAAGIIDDYIVDAIMDNRPFADMDDFYTLAADETGYMEVAELKKQLPDTLLDTKSNYFQLNARVSLVGTEIGLRSTFYRQGADVKTLSRTFEYLPRLELADGQVDPLLSPCYTPDDEAPLSL